MSNHPEFQKGLTDGRRDIDAGVIDAYWHHIEDARPKTAYESGYAEAFEEIENLQRLRMANKAFYTAP